MGKQTAFALITVDIDYIKYLNQHADSRVQFNPAKEATYQSKPYVGVLLFVDGMPYFAPIESPRPGHQNMRSNLHIIKVNDGRDGLIGLNNMIPVPKESIRMLDIYSAKYRTGMQRCFVFCQTHRKEICQQAQKVHEHRKHPNGFEKRIYCDFAKLEEACYHYCREKGYAIPEQLAKRFEATPEKHWTR